MLQAVGGCKVCHCRGSTKLTRLELQSCIIVDACSYGGGVIDGGLSSLVHLQHVRDLQAILQQA